MFENYINHFMSKDISELLVRFNRNSSLNALELKKNKNLKSFFLSERFFQDL